MFDEFCAAQAPCLQPAKCVLVSVWDLGGEAVIVAADERFLRSAIPTRSAFRASMTAAYLGMQIRPGITSDGRWSAVFAKLHELSRTMARSVSSPVAGAKYSSVFASPFLSCVALMPPLPAEQETKAEELVVEPALRCP